MPSNPVEEIGKSANNLKISSKKLQTSLSRGINDLQKRKTSTPVKDIFASWTTDVSDAEFADWLQNDAEMLYDWYCGLEYPSFKEKYMALNLANSILISAKKLRLDISDADLGLSDMQRDLRLDDKFWEFTMRKEGATEEEIEAQKVVRAKEKADRTAAEAAVRASGSGSSGRGASRA